METTPPEQARGAVQGYSRADVDQYLMAAAAERRRLEGAIGEAHERRQHAEAAAAAPLETAALVHTKLQEVQRELTQNRLRIDAEVEAIVGRARDQAATILRAARTQAHGLLEPTDPTSDPAPPAPPAAAIPTSEPPAPPAAPPVDHYSFEAALSTLTAPEPSPVPTVPVPETPDIDLTVEDAFWETPAAVGAHNGTARNGASSNGASSNGASSNGASSNGSSNGHASLAADDEVANGSESRPANGFATLLRRARTARPTEAGYTEEDDAFFDFLRGALDDDAPLGPRAAVDGDQTP